MDVDVAVNKEAWDLIPFHPDRLCILCLSPIDPIRTGKGDICCSKSHYRQFFHHCGHDARRFAENVFNVVLSDEGLRSLETLQPTKNDRPAGAERWIGAMKMLALEGVKNRQTLLDRLLQTSIGESIMNEVERRGFSNRSADVSLTTLIPPDRRGLSREYRMKRVENDLGDRFTRYCWNDCLSSNPIVVYDGERRDQLSSMWARLTMKGRL